MPLEDALEASLARGAPVSPMELLKGSVVFEEALNAAHVGAGANVLVFSRFETAGSVTSGAPLAPSHGRGKTAMSVNRPLNCCNRADQHEQDRQMTMQSKNKVEDGLHDQTG